MSREQIYRRDRSPFEDPFGRSLWLFQKATGAHFNQPGHSLANTSTNQDTPWPTRKLQYQNNLKQMTWPTGKKDNTTSSISSTSNEQANLSDCGQVLVL